MPIPDKRVTIDDIVGEITDGMTIGIGGWGSRRKPMAIIRALLRSSVKDLTVVSFGGPDVGLLARAGKIRHTICPFVSLDTIPLEPHFRAARQAGAFTNTELDEGMFLLGLQAQAWQVPFLPTRVGLGSSVTELDPKLATVTSPYGDHEELLAMPAIELDVALIHMNRGDQGGSGQYLGVDPYFDDLLCGAAKRRFMSVERIIPTEEFLTLGPPQSLLISRLMTDGVVETPHGAHFTACAPDYERDEAFQREYAATAKSDEAWEAFASKYLDVSEDEYQAAIR